ncbi:MAG TPA: hypothetical protein VIH57_04780, partial [Bacteroidales bacterium]
MKNLKKSKLLILGAFLALSILSCKKESLPTNDGNQQLAAAQDLKLTGIGYPAPKTSLQHKLTLTGSSTAVNVDANSVLSKACRDNMGAANFRITWVNTSASFFNTAGTSYIFSTVCENQLKSLNLPMSRIYFTYYEAGGLHNGLDMLAVVCNRNNIPQNKIIICIEHYQASTILGVPVYQDAINYVKSKGYGFKYWEISNEPQYAWGSGLENPVTYAQHVKDCYAAVKAIDSTMIVGCEICRRSWYTDQVLSNINGKADFIAGHWYGITNTDQYSTTDLILAENFKDLDYIAYENQNILSKTGKPIPQIDTEWRLLADGTVNGVSQTGEWNDKCGNIVGTLHQAVRMIYTVRDGYTLGSNCWHTAGNQPGVLVPAGYSQKSVLLDGKTTYLYWLYNYMINNTGDYVVDFNGTAPSYTGSAIHNVDDGSSGNLTYTGPLTPLMVTKSSDGTKLYITIVNGSTTQTVPFTAKISNFTPTTQSAVVITDTDVNQSFYQNDNSRFVKNGTVTYSAGTVSCSLAPLSVTFITLTGTSTSTTTTTSSDTTSTSSTTGSSTTGSTT